MKMKSIVVALGLSLLSLTALAAGPKRDVAGSADHPLLSRFPGSRIVKYEQHSYDEYVLPLGPSKGKKKGEFERADTVKGKITSIEYRDEGRHSVLEIFENYVEALASVGFETLYTCVKPEQCGRNLGSYMGAAWYGDSRYLAARGGDPSAPVYVALFVHKRGSSPTMGVLLRIIETRPLKVGQIKATSAADIQRALAAQGKFALYGLYFDTGKAALRPESDAELSAVAEVLEGSPSLELYVVGHTDSTGAMAANVALSERRAAAAVEALVGRYGIAAKRLTPKGVGPFAPVASNDTEEGRAKNRRVELVRP